MWGEESPCLRLLSSDCEWCELRPRLPSRPRLGVSSLRDAFDFDFLLVVWRAGKDEVSLCLLSEFPSARGPPKMCKMMPMAGARQVLYPQRAFADFTLWTWLHSCEATDP